MYAAQLLCLTGRERTKEEVHDDKTDHHYQQRGVQAAKFRKQLEQVWPSTLKGFAWI